MATSMMNTPQNNLLRKESSSEPVPVLASNVAAERKAHHHSHHSVTQPSGTFVYTVGKTDTLSSIAARYETTPSELAEINRIVSRLVFPGQVLYVPNKSYEGKRRSSDTSVMYKEKPKELTVQSCAESPQTVQGSPKPGHVERIRESPTSPSSPKQSDQNTLGRLTEEEERKLDLECIERFLKINVKHITDGQGVVSGVLLVTPNAVMFDPSVVDILVKEHGVEKYGVIAPMENVANAALYYDIANMKVRNVPLPHLLMPEPEIYHGKVSLSSVEGETTSQEFHSDSSKLDVSQPSRSDSQQAVKGSVSDEDDVDNRQEEVDEEEEEGRDDKKSIGSCHSDNKTDRTPSPDDSVFTNSEACAHADKTSEVPSGFSHSDAVAAAIRLDGYRRLETADTMGSVASIQSLDSLPEMQAKTDEWCRKGTSPKTTKSTQSSSSVEEKGMVVQEKENTVEEQLKEPATSEVRNGKVNQIDTLSLKSTTGKPEEKQKQQQQPPPKSPSSRSPLMSFLSDALWPSSADAESSSASPPPPPTCSPSSDSSGSEKPKLNLFKRLSNPLTGFVSTSSSDENSAEGDKAQGEGTTTTTTVLSKILYGTSPKNLVDFSSGLFLRSGDDSGKVQDVSQLPEQRRLGTAASSLGDGRINRRASSPEQRLCEAVNPYVGGVANIFQGHISDGVATSAVRGEKARNSTPGSKEDLRVEFRSEVTAEDTKDLFRPVESVIPEEFEIIPRPARSCDDPPLYLCLRMGHPMSKRVPSTTPIMSYGRRHMKSEYWFSIPRERVDELYNFFQHWAPGVYGDLVEVDFEAKGFRLVVSDDETSDEEPLTLLPKTGERSNGTSSGRKQARNNESAWEMVSVNDLRHVASFGQLSLDLEMAPPDLIGQTEILTEDHRKAICKVLPARAEGYSWSLIFSASQHGYSLQSMYRKMASHETPVLLVIQDSENNVFGAVTSCTFKVSDHFYGTGESFLFTFFPNFKVFKWTGENVFFIKGNLESLAIGAGDGLFGLWMDGDLYHGRSHRCKTYNNDTLSNGEDFCIRTLEAWGFMEFGAFDSSC